MTWTLLNQRNDEASKIRWELVPYFCGRILDIGCGGYKAFPHFIGVDNGKMWGKQWSDVSEDAAKLDMWVSGSCDGVFSSHLLEHIDYSMIPLVLSEWCRVVKDGGHIMLYVPDEAQYPKVGTEYANPDHKWDVNYDKIIAAMETLQRGWDLVDYQVRSENDEYSLFFVFKLSKGRERKYSYRDPKPTKTCAVVRYGAFGDLIQTSSILPGLKEQGYHITLYCSHRGYPVIKHDPHIDRFIIQESDAVPPQFLGEFWGYTRRKYDKWVNLSESVEGSLLTMPGRVNYYWPDEMKAKHLDCNYIEFTHEIAGVPPPYRPKFYSTPEERVWAKERARYYGGRNILWSLAGSAVHKVWPHLDAVVARMLLTYPEVHIVMVGDEACQIIEQPWTKEKRIHCHSGRWTIRESMAFAEVADLIIGTETGLLNAAGSMDTPKIVTLSHSSENMLTKHWKNTIALSQPNGTCKRQPCRTLHQEWSSCMKHEATGTAMCQFEITADMMWDAVQRVLGEAQRKVA